MPPTIPAVSTPEKSLLLKAAEMTQGQPWAGPSFGGGGGESAGSQFLSAPLTPRPNVGGNKLPQRVHLSRDTFIIVKYLVSP